MKWRRFIRILHRDIGYVVAALTIIYSVSGIAVNHINDWNPNYIVEHDSSKIIPLNDSLYSAEFAREYLIRQLGITDSIKSHFRKTLKAYKSIP